MVEQNEFMKAALEIAIEASENGEIPVGAVIINKKTGEIICKTRNEVENRSDPTAHAEMLAIKEAVSKLGSKWLQDYDLYVTLEPCPMCAQAISLVRIGRLYYGTEDKKSGGVDNGPRVLHSKSAHFKPEIYGGLMENECAEILEKFFSDLRSKEND